MRRQTILIALMAGLTVGGTAQAQTPIACVFDRLTAAERKMLGEASTDGDAGPEALKTLDETVGTARAACEPAQGWDANHRNMAVDYAVSRATAEAMEARLVAKGVSLERFRIGGDSLSAADRTVFDETPSDPEAVKRAAKRLDDLGVAPEDRPAGLIAWQARLHATTLATSW